ncbi:hypothetical protein MKW92_010622 [Papaver armeniacum]|nr:hypothetical protein MKW92_010622 [Papaver armeniacum]
MASISLSISSPSSITPRSNRTSINSSTSSNSINLRFCGLRREVLGFSSLKQSCSSTNIRSVRQQYSTKISASSSSSNGSANGKGFDYDLVIIGAGVGGHGAALHAVEKGLKTAIIEGDVVGGTCVNRGCVPSKALLAVSGRMRELQNEQHMKAFGLQVSAASYDRQAVADHANNLASKIRNNLTNSMKALGVDILTGYGSVVVTFIEALDQLMPGFDPEIGKLAQRVLINPRKIDYHVGVFASKITPAKDGKPVQIELIDAKTKEHKETLEVDAALIATGRAPFTKGLGLENINVETQRGFVPVDERMQVIDKDGKLVPNLYCIGDANGKLMLAHAASAQGISVVEQVTGRDHVLNHLSIPAACFTHPEISFVGYTEPQAREKAQKEGFEISIAKTSFKANTKALAENEGEGLAKLIYRPDNGEILGVHIFGMHAADLIHEASNAIAMGTRIQDIKYAVHAHPTLSEVLDELFKSAHVNANVTSQVKEPVAA